MKFKFGYILIGLGIILILIVGGFVTWAQDTMGPGEQALTALEAGGDVNVTVGEDAIIFQPQNVEPDTALIFYPGGRVDYRSYTTVLREIAAQGYMIVLVPAPLNLMVFNPNSADTIIPQYPQIEHWAVGGHSLGGAMAAQYAGSHFDIVEGLVLWASYPASNNNLSDSSLKVLSIYGTLDMGGMQPFDDSRALLPTDTTWIVIEGGNHAQFGDYGFQPGDNVATISSTDQQSQVVTATEKFLRSLGE